MGLQAEDTDGRDLANFHPDNEEATVKVREWMSKPLLSVKPLDPITRARELMVEKRINQLAVVQDGTIIGVVTDRDLRDAFPSTFATAWADASPSRRKLDLDPKTVKVEMVMTADVATIDADSALVDAADVIRQRRIGALPVTDGGKPAGIITRSDILRAFVAGRI